MMRTLGMNSYFINRIFYVKETATQQHYFTQISNIILTIRNQTFRKKIKLSTLNDMHLIYKKNLTNDETHHT